MPDILTGWLVSGRKHVHRSLHKLRARASCDALPASCRQSLRRKRARGECLSSKAAADAGAAVTVATAAAPAPALAAVAPRLRLRQIRRTLDKLHLYCPGGSDQNRWLISEARSHQDQRQEAKVKSEGKLKNIILKCERLVEDKRGGRREVQRISPYSKEKNSRVCAVGSV